MRVCLRPLRSNAVDVAGEHGAFLHIRYSDAEEAGGDTFEADGEAAVRGHAVSAPRSVPPARRRRAYLPPRMAYPRPIGRTRVSRKAIVGGR